ncbi:MAG: hypothetical protein JRJ03_03620 [Deltaproteobacteria bacterium]|nr:hypothetical protein [Deltaproteobacteria bacterium]
MVERQTSRPLHRIREQVLMLSVGREYVSSELMLKKIGEDLLKHAQELKKEIQALKRRFPGKLVREVEADNLIREFQDKVRLLREPDEKILQKCSAGQLGRELEEDVKALAGAVQGVQDLVEGRSATFTKKDSMLSTFGRLKVLFRPVSTTGKVLFRMVSIAILLGAVTFLVLYFTMEKEEGLREEVTRLNALIELQKDRVNRLSGQIAELSRKVDALRDSKGEELTRQERLNILELNVTINKLMQDRQKAEVQISFYENEIADRERRIKALKGKSFIRRLLRQ